jgi:hypothetical protein
MNAVNVYVYYENGTQINATYRTSKVRKFDMSYELFVRLASIMTIFRIAPSSTKRVVKQIDFTETNHSFVTVLYRRLVYMINQNACFKNNNN